MHEKHDKDKDGKKCFYNQKTKTTAKDRQNRII